MSSATAQLGPERTRLLWAAGAGHPETPRWLAHEAQIAFIDGTAGELLRVAPDGGGGSRLAIATELGFIAPAADGRLLYGSGTTVGCVGAASAFAQVPGEVAILRLNDAGFDSAGGLWTGTMDRRGAAPIGALWRIDADGRADQALDGFTIPNGFAFTRDGRTLYVADSPQRVVHAMELDGHGRLRARRVFASGAAMCRGFPDGMAIDAEDHLWIAFYDGGCVARYRPDGSLQREVQLPVSRVTACAFGGENLATLFVTAGDGLHAFEPEVPGLAAART